MSALAVVGLGLVAVALLVIAYLFHVRRRGNVVGPARDRIRIAALTLVTNAAVLPEVARDAARVRTFDGGESLDSVERLRGTIACVLEESCAWTLARSVAAPHIGATAKGRMSNDQVEELSTPLAAGSEHIAAAVAAAKRTVEYIDKWVMRSDDQLRRAAALEQSVDDLRLDAGEPGLAAARAYRRARDECRDALDEAGDTFAVRARESSAVATGKFAETIPAPPRVDGASVARLQAIVEELAAAAAGLAASFQRHLARGSDAEGTQDAIERLHAGITSAHARSTGGDPLSALIELADAVPTGALPRRYERKVAAAARSLQRIVDENRAAVTAWASSVAGCWAGAVEELERSITSTGAELEDRRGSAWRSLEVAVEALRLEARELLGAASTTRAQTRLAATAAAATAVGRACTPNLLQRIVESSVGATAIDVSAPVREIVATVRAQVDARRAGVAALAQDARALAEEGLASLLAAAGASEDDVAAACRAMAGGDVDITEAEHLATWALDWTDVPSAPARSGTAPALDGWTPVLAEIDRWIARPAPYGDALAELQHRMHLAGLTPDQTALLEAESVAASMTSFSTTTHAFVVEFADGVMASFAYAHAAFLEAHAHALADAEIAELDAVADRFRDQAARYLAKCEALAGTGSSEFAALAAALAPDDKPDVWAVLYRLATAAPPVAIAWEPAAEFDSACAAFADTLRETTGELVYRLTQCVADASTDLSNTTLALARVTDESLKTMDRRYQEAWHNLARAARDLQLAVLERLFAAPALEAALPVRAALTVHAVDDRAVSTVSAAVGELIPAADGAQHPTVEDKLRAAEERANRYKQSSAVLAGVDGLLLSAMAYEGFASFSPTIVGLSTGAGDAHAAVSNLLTGLHDPEFHHAAMQSAVHAFHISAPDLLSIAGSHMQFTEAMSASSAETMEKVFGIHTEASAEAMVATLLTQDVHHVASSIIGDLAHTPGGQAAAFHLDQAAHALGPALLHGLIAHVPIATAVLATAREVRLKREHELQMRELIMNASLDVVVVGGSAAAAIGSTSLLHLGPHGVVTVPATVAAVFVARHGLRRYRRRKVTKLQTKLLAAQDAYEAQQAEIVAGFYDGITREMDQARTAFLGAVGEPPTVESVMADRPAAVAAELVERTARYADSLSLLLEPVTAGHTDAQDRLDLSSLGDRVSGAGDAADRALDMLRVGDWEGAMLATTESALPATDVWRPAETYRRTCDDVARELSRGSDERRMLTRSWLDSALTTFDATKTRLDPRLDAADQALNKQIAAAEEPVTRLSEGFLVEYQRVTGRTDIAANN